MYMYMTLLGLSTGFRSATLAALQVALFGQGYIGTVRSLFTSLMVLSSAVGPALYGFMLDAGLDFDSIFIVSLALLFLIMLQSFRIIPKHARAKWMYKYKKIVQVKVKI